MSRARAGKEEGAALLAKGDHAEGNAWRRRVAQLWQSPLVRAVLLAQILSLLLCVMGTTSGLLAGRGVDMPTSQAVLNYALLGLTAGGHHLWTRGNDPLSAAVPNHATRGGGKELLSE
ncbi:hypothetical protein TSOC_004228 [Tetrabaena socialis]|uniref:Uncharacterized protein n=1 Tax=Tetrabaena socialis TaxID=47790 RepID=A0A2J8A9H1_9CHLO|nr:hypothetical protein TSOC_004228 [Tetrabaena socialis]|eukprot:PNH09174.1 hypothetical protein TSOC_004228 [Tetrabaena socialis]